MHSEQSSSSKPHCKIQVKRELYGTLIVTTLQNLRREIVLRKTLEKRCLLVAKIGKNKFLIYKCSGTRIRRSTPRLPTHNKTEKEQSHQEKLLI